MRIKQVRDLVGAKHTLRKASYGQKLTWQPFELLPNALPLQKIVDFI